MTEQLALLPDYLTAHLELTLFALLAGVLGSVPLGILLSRRPRLERVVMALANIVQTIPGLALLALMVPLLAALHLPSIGHLPAFLALVLYSTLPILRNTVTGLAGVDPAVVEAARAVGMTPRERLVRVELPLALPVIVAGIRTATTWTVGMATLSTPVGGVSLGNYIFSGLQTRNLTAVLVGCLAAAALALVLDGLGGLLLFGVERRRRVPLRIAVLGFLLLYAYAGGSLVAGLLPGRERPVVIGTKTFTEQYILGQLLAAKIESATGTPTDVKEALGSTVAFDALATGQIDVYVDYSGTLWATIIKRQDRPPQREQAIAEIRRFLDQRFGIRLVGTLGFENAYALAMRHRQAADLGIRTIADLARHSERLSIGGDYEFFSRPEFSTVVAMYDLHFKSQRSMDPALMYQAVANGSVDVISAFSSDGRINALDLTLLEDDRGAIPPYDAVILAGRRVIREHPAVLHALEALTDTVDGDAMRRMNLRVDSGDASPAEVARSFLEYSPPPSVD